jgi:hypothetical protein
MICVDVDIALFKAHCIFFLTTQRHRARLTIGDEVVEITSVSTNEIVIKYKIVYYQIITIIKIIETNMRIINEEEPSQKTARLLDVSGISKHCSNTG